MIIIYPIISIFWATLRILILFLSIKHSKIFAHNFCRIPLQIFFGCRFNMIFRLETLAFKVIISTF